MSQSLASILIHIIFSTKQRKPIIFPEIKQSLYTYMVGIAKIHNAFVHEIGGVEDHVHMLISLHKTTSLCKVIEEVKKGSSKWIKSQEKLYMDFAWQNGYGAFSIGQSSYESLRKYIKQQEEHHKKVSFQDEFRSFLKKYRIDFDEKYVWD